MYKIKNCLIYNEDSNDVIKNIESNSIDLILTDPPYELGNFRKKIGEWEKSKITESGIFKECLRILKPGGHLVCFSSNRTMYKFGSSIENSGFEIRNTLIWEYKQSIPRNMDIGKAIDCQITYGKTSSKYMKQIEQEYGGASYKIKGTNNTMFGDKTEFERKEYEIDWDNLSIIIYNCNECQEYRFILSIFTTYLNDLLSDIVDFREEK